MRVRQTVKRLFAVATGAAMLGATAMGALAADLGDYPTMFVEDGTYNGFFVVGENAASVDNLAMTDIATSMMAPGSGSGVSVDVDGDAWLVGTSAEWLELNESIGPTGTNGIVDFIDGGDLAALGDGTFSNSKGSYDFEQKLFFDKTTGAGGPHAIFEENDDDVLDVFWKIASDDQIARYQLNFVTDAETDIDASDSQSLDDFEDKSFTFMGTSWTMTTARYTVNSGGTVALTFMGGATLATLSEGDSGSYTVDGTDYDVAVTFVDADEVAFVVNGEATGKLNDGETYTLADGNDVGVSNILYQDYAGGIHSADFFLGANKLYMTDNISDTAASGTEIKVNEETIDGAVPYIKGTVVTGTTDTSTDGELKIDLIEVNMTAQDDIWLSAGDKLSTDSELEESGLLFTENWDMEFHGFQDEEATNDIMLQKSGDDKYKLAFTAGDGSSVEVPLMYATGSNIYTGDKAGDNLALSLTNVTDDDYFVLNSKDAATAGNDDAVTTVLQYLSSKNSADSTQTIKFKNLNTGDTFERTFEDDCTFDISVGGKTHNFVNASSHVCTSDNWPIAISGTDFTYDNTKSGNETVHTLSMRDASGALIQVADQGWGTDANGNDTDNDWTQGLGTTEGLTVTLKVDDSDRGDDVVSLTSARTETQYNVTYTATDEVRASRLSFSGWTSSDPDDTDVTWGYTDYGSKLYHVAPSSTPQEFTLTVPETARKMALYVTSGATTTSTSASGDLAPVTVVDATKLDSEIASVDAQNLIVVGGPCVNSVSAELLGSPSDCTEGFTPGRARVKLFEHANGNMAMLVAGFSGQDTRLAGRVLAHRSGELTGMEVEIEGTTFSDATIGAPAPVVMVEETVEEVVVDDSTGTE